MTVRIRHVAPSDAVRPFAVDAFGRPMFPARALRRWVWPALAIWLVLAAAVAAVVL